MAIDTFIPTSLANIHEFIINHEKENITQVWIYKDNEYLGSILPKIKRVNIIYDNVTHTLAMIVYKNNQTIRNDMSKEEISLARNLFDDHLIVIKEYELEKYKFQYI
jgi:hypothetical protein